MITETSPGSDQELQAARAKIRALEAEVARQRAAIDELSEDRAFRAAVIDSAAEGVCVCHDNAEFPFVRFTVWNPRMVAITGYSMVVRRRRSPRR